MKTLTWLNAIEYIETHDDYAPQIIATMRQNFTKSYGFSIKGKRATNQDQIDWRVWLASKPLPLMTRDDWLNSGEQVLAASDMTPTQQRNKRFFFLKFVNNLEDMGHLLVLSPPDPEPVEGKNQIKGQKPRRRRKPEWAGQPIDENPDRVDKVLLNEEIILKLTAAFYLPFYRERYPERMDEELLTIIQKELDRIKASLKGFRHYLGIRPKGRQRGPTQDITITRIMMLLGWVFKQTEDLAEVSLTKLIPVVNIRISMHEFKDANEYFIRKGKLENEIEVAAEYVVDFLLEYFENYNPNYGSGSKKLYINALINLAKYLYQKINRKTKCSNFQDIPIIEFLRGLRSDLPKPPPRAKKVPLTLDVLVEYLEKFKVDLDYPYNDSINNGGYLIKAERKMRHIAHDMQRFLMLCLLVLVHPLRRRSLAELQWGKTLVKGIKTEEGNFIRQEKMADPSQALYYYDMLPEEYKTGGNCSTQ